MTRRSILMTIGVIALTAGGFATFHFAGIPAMPYAGLETRTIKSVPEEQIKGLREGQGLGYALAAELNGYPGPRHVLELAPQLDLTPEQRVKTEALFAQMKAEARELGARKIEAETVLDQAFAQRRIDEAKLEQLTASAAEIDGALRAAHLKYHLAMRELLTEEQQASYGALRGYGVHGGSHTGH
jgi:Spy/CpxP family protein refolding chaperone